MQNKHMPPGNIFLRSEKENIYQKIYQTEKWENLSLITSHNLFECFFPKVAIPLGWILSLLLFMTHIFFILSDVQAGAG